MTLIDFAALGVIVMAIIYWFTKKKKNDANNVVLFDKDAERREQWAAQQAKFEAEIETRLQAYKQKKDEYFKLKERLNNATNSEGNTNGDTVLNNNPADVYVLKPRGDGSSDDKPTNN